MQANYSNGRERVSVGLILILWDEDGIFFQYAPELDLTGYGSSAIEAAKSFEYILEDFIKYTLNKGTIYDELERLGWSVNNKKKKIKAPEEDQLLENNETYKELITMPGIRLSSTDFALSL